MEMLDTLLKMSFQGYHEYGKKSFLGLAELCGQKVSKLKEMAKSHTKNTNKITRQSVTLPTGYHNIHRRNFYTWITYKRSLSS